MKEPSPRASRLALTAALLAVAVVGGGGFLLGARSAADGPATVAAAPAPTSVTPVPAPTEDAPRTLGRADLIALAAAAADASAQGTPVPAAVRDAVGKSFSIALPFGCDGPAPADSEATMRWRYDEAAGALRVHVAPIAWSPGEWWPGDAPADVEAVEGFWIARPWTASEACPRSREAPAADGTQAITLPGQTLAIGQMFGTGGARQGRRDGKPYTAVLRMAPDAVAGDQGFRLRLTGRIVAARDGSPATCRQPGGAEQRPVCMILTALDAIVIANPRSNEILATWPVDAARIDGSVE